MKDDKEQVIDKLDEILANQELIMDELGIEKPKPQPQIAPGEEPDDDRPPKP